MNIHIVGFVITISVYTFLFLITYFMILKTVLVFIIIRLFIIFGLKRYIFILLDNFRRLAWIFIKRIMFLISGLALLSIYQRTLYLRTTNIILQILIELDLVYIFSTAKRIAPIRIRALFIAT